MSQTQPRLPRLNAILAFKTAAEAGSLAKAALALSLTPAAISQQIRQLELQLSTQLFLRTQQGVQLTEAGKEYLRYVSEAFDLLQLAQQSLYDEVTPSRLTIWSLPALASKWLTPAITAWQQAQPDIALVVHGTHAHINVAATPADFVICFGEHHYPQLEKVALFQDEVVPVASPTLAARFHDAHDFCQAPLIHLDWGNEGRFLPAWRDWLLARDVPASTVAGGLTFNLTSLAIDAAVQGAGLLLGQRRLIQRELARGELVVLDSLSLALHKPYFLAWPTRTLHQPGADAMLRWLQQLAQQPLY
ncbi:LysR substrate-binding domain-containing protein [[Erwinia] mediterraneensis]|uniref:LysR substrate-binding domain-containing protein n=1 Tax=[Erwinia] mediterraneensis TaxID=2161819 RepID=UPI0010306421|nr:LysR substrate-binding domain-containing protein [[Erwinia] mediterraneensis]